MKQKYNFYLSNIGDMDETVMKFTRIINRTVKKRSTNCSIQKYRPWNDKFYSYINIHGKWNC